MQIDFHYATTYVVARLAGFTTDEAGKIAYCSQYVDDASQSGVLRFDNGKIYPRYATAHKTFNALNWYDAENILVWVPFHFLPGAQWNQSARPSGDPEVMICRKDSQLAREAAYEAIQTKNLPYGLHRLGVVAHVYADTWAHEGFVGMLDILNDISEVKELGRHISLLDRAKMAFSQGKILMKRAFAWLFSWKKAARRWQVPGHALAFEFPDRPYASWSFRYERPIYSASSQRRNYDRFLEAADALYTLFLAYRAGNPVIPSQLSRIPNPDRDKLYRLFQETISTDEKKRYQAWAEAAQEGAFSFGSDWIEYYPRGEKSWKFNSVLADNLFGHSVLPSNNQSTFLNSDWRMFHEAAKAHREFVLKTLLPRYGIVL